MVRAVEGVVEVGAEELADSGPQLQELRVQWPGSEG